MLSWRVMARNREQIAAERNRLRSQYGKLFDATASLLCRHDPVRINLDFNTDEYEPEVGTILPRLHSCKSEEDVRRVVHEEFVRWFDEHTAGPEERYTQIAAEIWQLWLTSNPR